MTKNMDHQNTIQTGQSIRTRILALILGLIFLSVIVIVYVSINSILRAGQDAQVVGNDILQNQAEEFLVQVTTDNALKNDADINDIRLDANHLAHFIGNIYADPDAFDSQSYWQATDKMYIAPDGQYVNREDDTSAIFAPNFVSVNEEYNTDLNLSAYLDSLAPAILESDNNTGAIYLIHRDEFTRFYPNIGLGFLVPPDYKATDDIFYAAGTPENNPERDVVWTPVYDDPAGQGLLVSAIAPIYINEDEFIGVIGIDLGLTGLAANIEEASTIANGYSFLVNDEGLALALPQQGYEDIFEEPLSSGTSGSGSDLSNISSSFTPIIEQMMSGKIGFQAIEANGKNLFVAYAPLPNTGWSLANVVEAENMLQVVDVLQEEIETSTQSLVLTRIIPISFVLMIIAIIIGLVLTNRLITPIQKLADTASLVGDGDWDQVGTIDPETHRNDEIGVLATAFQKMTGQLKSLVTDLESRVAARTQDLNLAAEIGRDIAQIRDVDELLSNSVERIRSRFDLYYTQIYLVNEHNTLLELSAGTGMIGEALLKKGHQLPLDTRSINGRAVTEKHPVIVADTSQSPTFRPNPSLPYTRSEMAIPLIAGDTVLGVIDLQSTTPGGLNESNLSAFETLAGQLAITLENVTLFKAQAQLTQELQEKTAQFEENSNFLDAIIDNLPTRLFVKDAKDLRYLRWNKAGAELFGMPTETVIGKTDLDIFPAELAHFYMQADRETLNKGVLFDVPEETAQSPEGLRVLHTLNVPILDNEGRPQFLLGISEDITAQKETERMLNERVKELNLLNEIGIKADEQLSLDEFLTYIANRIPAGMQHAELCKVAITLGDQVYGAPEAVNLPSQIVEGLRLDGEQIGRIYIAYTEKQSFLNEESALIGSIGRRVTDYIANRRLLDRVQATVEGLQTVADISTVITSQQDTQQLLQNVVDLTKAQFNFYHAHIYLYDEMIDALVLSAGAGEIGRQMVGESRQIPLSAPRSLVARAARERRGLVVANVKTDPSFLPHPLLPETRSEMAVPLTVGDQLIGVMDIQSSEVNGFTPEDVNIQTTLASQIAVALQNAEQYEQTQSALDEVNALQRALTHEGWQAYMMAVNRPTQGYQTAQNEIQPILREDVVPANGNDENGVVAYPLSVRGIAIGQIGVNTRGKQLSADDLILLESISDQVAEALERARLFEETEIARSQTEDLFSGSEKVVRATTLDEILRALIQATALNSMERASIIFFDQPWETTPPEMMIVGATWRNDNELSQIPMGTTFPLALHPTAHLLDRERPFVITDIETDTRMDENTRAFLMKELDMRSAILLPLVVGNQWLGFVMSLSTEIHAFTENEIRQISSLVGQAATVAQSQRLYQTAQAQARHEQILREVSAKVTSAVDAESVLQTATREIGRALGLETFVYLKNPNSKKTQ